MTDITKSELIQQLSNAPIVNAPILEWWEAAPDFPVSTIEVLVKSLWGATLAAAAKNQGLPLVDRVQFYQFRGTQPQIQPSGSLQYEVIASLSVRIITFLDAMVPDSADWLIQLINSLNEGGNVDLTPVLNKLDTIIANQSPYFSMGDFLARANQHLISKTGGWVPEVGFFGGKPLPFWRISSESATGEIVFGDFTLGSKLRFMVAGGLNERPETKLIQLINVSNSNVLLEIQAMSVANVRQDTLVLAELDTTQWIGQTIRIKFLDNDSALGWARMNVGNEFLIEA